MTDPTLRERSDDELVADYRRVKADLSPESTRRREAIEEEMRRRGLAPDREDVIPDATPPVRETEPSPSSRGTAPDADEDTPG
jgi:hypothetical protein